MSQNAKMGLFAVAIVGSLSMCGGGIVAGVLLSKGQDKSTVTAAGKAVGLGDEEAAKRGKELAGRRLSDGDPKDNESYILGHKWWKVPPTKEKLAKIVERIVLSKSGTTVSLDRSGRIQVGFETEEGYEKWKQEPKAIRQLPQIDIVGNWSVRPDRTQVLERIRERLDAAEYEHGPGH